MTVAVCRVEAAVIKVGEGHPPTTEGMGEVEISLDGPPLLLPWTLPRPNELPGVVMKGSAKRQNASVVLHSRETGENLLFAMNFD